MLANPNRIPLIEKSKIAAAKGGPQGIRQLPLTDRLEISLEIAKELGRKKAVTACAKDLLVRKLVIGKFDAANEIGEKYLGENEKKYAYGKFISIGELHDKVCNEAANTVIDGVFREQGEIDKMLGATGIKKKERTGMDGYLEFQEAMARAETETPGKISEIIYYADGKIRPKDLELLRLYMGKIER